MNKKPEPPANTEEVLARVVGMLLAGAREDEILGFAKTEKWPQKPGEIRKAIDTARENFVELLGLDQTTALGVSLARLNHILAKSLQIQDYKTAFRIQNEITGLLLSSPDVILGPDVGPKTGRPLADIDEKTVYGMAMIGATNTEIAQICGVEEGTIRNRFKDTLAAARANLKRKLRRTQIAKALEGNPTMLIWLGKQMLNQRDRSDVTTDDKPLPHSVKVVLVKPDQNPDDAADG